MGNRGGWIGVDLDGTLAHYEGWKGETHIGAPIPLMVRRVQEWLAAGWEVRIFTARISGSRDGAEGIQRMKETIERWCQDHIGAVLPITNVKDYAMVQLWDDRAIQVVPNTGRRADGAESHA